MEHLFHLNYTSSYLQIFSNNGQAVVLNAYLKALLFLNL